MLLSDGYEVYGFGALTGRYDRNAEDLFVSNFLSHYKWELTHDGQPLLRVEYNDPKMPPRIDEGLEDLSDTLSRTLPAMTAESVDRFCRLARAAADGSHGTILVVSEEAEAEVLRLQPQAIRLEPEKLSDKILDRVSRIDGAVLFDPDCRCHAIGVILDGLAASEGDPARGSRFNSAFRYVRTRKKGVVAVVISDDGMINVFPDLMPRISKYDLEDAIRTMREYATEKPPSPKLADAHRELQKLAFYLSAEQCKEINELAIEAEKNRDRDEPWCVLHPLFPDPEMNGSYFL